MKLSIRTILALGLFVSLVGAGFGDGFKDAVSSDGDPAPMVFSWEYAAPVNPLAFSSVGAVDYRSSSEFLSVDHDPDGDLPREAVFLADGSAVVVVNRDTDNVVFFDVNARAITDTVSVGDFPVYAAVSPDNHYVVVPNVLSHDVSVIDVATRALLANVPITGEQPYRVAITPDSNYAVVGVINDAVDSSFSVINLNTLAEEYYFPSASQGVFGFFFTPEPAISGNLFTQFALTPDGGKIVLANRGGGEIAIYDRFTGAETILAVPSSPTAIDVSADGTLAVVSHESSPGMISTIDLTTLSVTNSFSTGDSLQSQVIRVTPDKAYAITAISNNAIFTNLATGVRSATINTGVVGDIELSYDGQYAFVSNFNSRVIDIASQSLVKTIAYAACAEAAVSPIENRAVALNNRFRENVHFYDINGASSFFEGAAQSGPIPEGDCPRFLAVSDDGELAIACNIVSGNVSIVDMNTRAVRSYVDVGDRAYAAAITPDNAYAVVCAADDHYVRIIDLTTDTVVKSFYIYSRPMAVCVSPDGQYAYVLNIAGGDRVHFIQLDGANSTILSSLPSGETGSVGTNLSGIGLSHDGSILAVCASFDDRLNLFDTATQTQIASVAVGDFPLRVAFSPDDTQAYVTNVFDDNVSIVEIDGPASHQITATGGMDYPITVECDSTGSYVYVANQGSNAGIRVLDTSSNSFVKTLVFSSGEPIDFCLSPTDGMLYAASSESELHRIAAAGAASAFVDSVALSSSPTDVAFDNWLGVAVVAQPFLDGVDIVQYGCAADLNADRQITLSDLAQLLASYGTTSGASRRDGDLDGDGDIDLSDLAALLGVYGQACP